MKSLGCAHKESYHKVCPGLQSSVELHGVHWLPYVKGPLDGVHNASLACVQDVLSKW